MVGDRAYSLGFFGSTDRGASLFYFAAALPAVGFAHGPADLYPLNAATLDWYGESEFINHGAENRYAGFLKTLD
jgi:hypothetical protein